MTETKPEVPKKKIEYFPYPVLMKKLFSKEIIPGLENIIAFDFGFVLDTHIEKYTIFIDSKYLNFALKESGKKLVALNLLNGENLQFPIYYYVAVDESYRNSKNSFLNVLYSNNNIKTLCKYLDMSRFKDESKSMLGKEINLALTPQMIVDMLKLIYHTDEKNKNINAIVLLSNNRLLVPAIKELVDNDIAVYLGVSTKVNTPTEMMICSSAIIELEAFLTNLGALVSI